MVYMSFKILFKYFNLDFLVFSAVLQVLEGRLSPAIGGRRNFIPSPLSKILAVSKNPNGVWV